MDYAYAKLQAVVEDLEASADCIRSQLLGSGTRAANIRDQPGSAGISRESGPKAPSVAERSCAQKC